MHICTMIRHLWRISADRSRVAEVRQCVWQSGCVQCTPTDVMGTQRKRNIAAARNRCGKGPARGRSWDYVLRMRGACAKRKVGHSVEARWR